MRPPPSRRAGLSGGAGKEDSHERAIVPLPVVFTIADRFRAHMWHVHGTNCQARPGIT